MYPPFFRQEIVKQRGEQDSYLMRESFMHYLVEYGENLTDGADIFLA